MEKKHKNNKTHVPHKMRRLVMDDVLLFLQSTTNSNKDEQQEAKKSIMISTIVGARAQHMLVVVLES